ncbi:MAG: DUF5696 domain-containing protein, partial [Lentisphaeria bacterium]|nr:DUF5696 domain-containing protein [Lentisphaeria bacterium]
MRHGICPILCLLCLEAAMFAAETPARRAMIAVTAKDGTVTRSERNLPPAEQGAYRLVIPASEIGPETNYIDLHFELAEAKRGDEGYFVLSDGRLGTFRADKGTIDVRRNPMPIFGMKTPAGTFVGIVKGLVYEFKTMVVADQGVYRMFPRFLIKDIVFAPYEDIVVDFHVLDGDDANYSGMARVYREYQLGRGEVIPLRERVKGNPQLTYAAGAMAIRVAHGSKPLNRSVEEQTLETEPPMNARITFEGLQEMMRKLKAMGVDEAEFCTVGWNIRGHDGRYPQLFPVEPALGGEEKLRETITLAHELGYQIVCHTNYTDAYKIADCWSEDFIAKKPDGTMQTNAIW